MGTASTYDLIARGYRRRLWPLVMNFLSTLNKDSVILDLGCGKGDACLYWLENGGRVCAGLDASTGMLKEALRTLKEVPSPHLLIAGDVEALPLRDESADSALLVSVLHHLTPKEARINALKELRRVLRDNGVALVSVWARYQPRIIIKVLRSLLKGYRGDSVWDILICSGLGCRHYHFYSLKELISNAKEAGLRVIDSGVYEAPGKGASRKNYFIIVRKAKPTR